MTGARQGDGPYPECSDVLDHINEYMDGEVSSADLASVREHLMACPPCLHQYEVQVALSALVRRCCQQDRAPEALRLRILTQITEVRLHVT